MNYEAADPQLCEILEKGIGIPVREIQALKDDPAHWVNMLSPLLHQPIVCSILRKVPKNIEESLKTLHAVMPYGTLGYLCHLARMNHAPSWLTEEEKRAWEKVRSQSTSSPAGLQLEEAGQRMSIVRDLLSQAGKPVKESEIKQRDALKRRQKIDSLLTHPIWGNLIAAVLFFGMFQAIYSWANISNGFNRWSIYFDDLNHF